MGGRKLLTARFFENFRSVAGRGRHMGALNVPHKVGGGVDATGGGRSLQGVSLPPAKDSKPEVKRLRVALSAAC